MHGAQGQQGGTETGHRGFTLRGTEAIGIRTNFTNGKRQRTLILFQCLDTGGFPDQGSGGRIDVEGRGGRID